MPDTKGLMDMAKVYGIRCMLSSLSPTIMYSIGYWSLSLIGKPIGLISSMGAPFFNLTAGSVIVAFSLLWPLQQLSLAFIFEPIFGIIRNKLRKSALANVKDKDKNGNPLPAVPFFFRGNFAPTSHEVSYKVLNISEGDIPLDINGTFLRNGPNIRTDDSDTMRSHWFAGDGMLHAVCINHG